MSVNNCKARQYSDQMYCGHCGVTWDVNDPDPPVCSTKEVQEKLRGQETLKYLKRKLKCNILEEPQAVTIE